MKIFEREAKQEMGSIALNASWSSSWRDKEEAKWEIGLTALGVSVELVFTR